MSEQEFWKQVDEMYLLNSSYAQRWLTLFLQSGLKQVTSVTVEQVRDLMLVDPKEYAQKSDLIKRCVYGPVDEINEQTIYQVQYSYLYNKRKPIVGFNFVLYERNRKKSLGEFVGSEHFVNLCKVYGIPSSHMLSASRHPLIVAALFQAHRDISNGQTIIVKSRHHYMLKVIENSQEFLDPVLNFKNS